MATSSFMNSDNSGGLRRPDIAAVCTSPVATFQAAKSVLVPWRCRIRVQSQSALDRWTANPALRPLQPQLKAFRAVSCRHLALVLHPVHVSGRKAVHLQAVESLERCIGEHVSHSLASANWEFRFARLNFVSHAQNSVSNDAAMRIRLQPDCENGMPQRIVFASFQ